MQYLQIVLTIIEIVKIVEKLIPESGQGASKLTLVRQLAEQAVGDIGNLWPQLEALITSFVKLSNIAGSFKK
jgi:hypothetical protein